jgi:hypothetical protein
MHLYSPEQLIRAARTQEELFFVRNYLEETVKETSGQRWWQFYHKRRLELGHLPSYYGPDQWGVPINPVEYTRGSGRGLQAKSVNRSLFGGVVSFGQATGRAPLFEGLADVSVMKALQRPGVVDPLIFDLETTGLLGRDSRILTVGMHQRGQVSEFFGHLDPTKRYDPYIEETIIPKYRQALAVSGQTTLTEKQVVKKFIKQLTPGRTVMGYNIKQFDIPILMEQASRHGLQDELHRALKQTHLLDVAEHTQAFLSNTIGRKVVGWQAGMFEDLRLKPRGWQLAAVAETLGFKGAAIGAHGAGFDVQMTEFIWDKLKDHKAARQTFLQNFDVFQAAVHRGTGQKLQLIDEGMRFQDYASKMLASEAEYARPFHEHLGKFYPEIKSNRSFVDIRRFKPTWGGALKGAGVVAGLGLVGLAISSRDEDYKLIEGMRDGGMAQRTRRQLTDFGSGYRGITQPTIEKEMLEDRLLTAKEYRKLVRKAVRAQEMDKSMLMLSGPDAFKVLSREIFWRDYKNLAKVNAAFTERESIGAFGSYYPAKDELNIGGILDPSEVIIGSHITSKAGVYGTRELMKYISPIKVRETTLHEGLHALWDLDIDPEDKATFIREAQRQLLSGRMTSKEDIAHLAAKAPVYNRNIRIAQQTVREDPDNPYVEWVANEMFAHRGALQVYNIGTYTLPQNPELESVVEKYTRWVPPHLRRTAVGLYQVADYHKIATEEISKETLQQAMDEWQDIRHPGRFTFNRIQGMHPGSEGTGAQAMRAHSDFGSGYRGPNPWLQPEWHQRKEVPKYTRFAPSKLGASEREIYKYLTEEQRETEMLTAASMAGVAGHRFFEAAQYARGEVEDVERFVHDPELGMAGFIDVLYPGGIPGDIKTVSARRLQHIRERGAFKKHEAQLRFYMHALGQEKGYLEYISREDPSERAMIEVPFDEAKFQADVEKLERVKAKVMADLEAGRLAEEDIQYGASIETMERESARERAQLEEEVKDLPGLWRTYQEELAYYNEVYARRFPRRNRAYKPINGLHPGSEGMGAQSVRSHSEFGSGWDPLRQIARKIFKDLPAEEAYKKLLSSRRFASALQKGTEVKKLGHGQSGMAHLFESEVEGHAFKYVLKESREFPKALKFLKQRSVGSIRKEYDVLREISGEITPTAYGLKDDRLFMEYMPGTPIYELRKMGISVPKKHIESEMRKQMSGVVGKGWMNIDPNMANILYSPESGHVSWIDFGMASRAAGVQSPVATMEASMAYHWGKMEEHLARAKSAGLKQDVHVVLDTIGGGPNKALQPIDGIHPGSEDLGAQSIRAHSEFGSGWMPRFLGKIFRRPSRPLIGKFSSEEEFVRVVRERRAAHAAQRPVLQPLSAPLGGELAGFKGEQHFANMVRVRQDNAFKLRQAEREMKKAEDRAKLLAGGGEHEDFFKMMEQWRFEEEQLLKIRLVEGVPRPGIVAEAPVNWIEDLKPDVEEAVNMLIGRKKDTVKLHGINPSSEHSIGGQMVKSFSEFGSGYNPSTESPLWDQNLESHQISRRELTKKAYKAWNEYQARRKRKASEYLVNWRAQKRQRYDDYILKRNKRFYNDSQAAVGIGLRASRGAGHRHEKFASTGV